MKKTIALITLASALSATSILAQSPEKKAEAFAGKKQMILELIEKRIEGLKGHKECISAANNPQDLKACRDKMKQTVIDNRNEAKKARKAQKEMRKAQKKK